MFELVQYAFDREVAATGLHHTGHFTVLSQDGQQLHTFLMHARQYTSAANGCTYVPCSQGLCQFA